MPEQIDWRAQVDLLLPTSTPQVSALDLAPARPIWRLYGAQAETRPQHISEIGNKAATVSEYFFFDDEPSPLFGAAPGVIRSGALGSWHPISSSANTYSVVSHGLDVTGVIGNIAALEDGWNGPGSVAPSVDVCCDISSVLNALWNICKEPEIEVGDDGDVALLWDGEGRSFALTFFGNGKVIGTMTPLDDHYRPWSASVAETQLLREKVFHTHVSALLA